MKFAEPVVQQESKTTPDKKAVDKVTAKVEAVKITEAQTFLKAGSYKVVQSDAQVQLKENLSLPSGFREFYKEATVNGADVIISDIELSAD